MPAHLILMSFSQPPIYSGPSQSSGRPRRLLPVSPRPRHVTRHHRLAAMASTTPVATPHVPPAPRAGSHRTGSPTLQISGLSEVADRYKALLLDQFGVLHDGRRPYPGAVEAVAAAAGAGLKLLIISNSSRRAGGTLDKLAAMGFDRDCFAGGVTSGELTHRYLTQRPDDWWAGLGLRCLHMNWSKRGPASLRDLGLQAVVDPRDADFFLAHGTEGLSLPGGGVQERPLEELRALLREAAEAAARSGAAPPPLLVANPDVVTVDGDELVAMPGSLAAAYSAAGGRVVLMGKPAPLIYAACGELLGLPADQLLAVGDSLEHDIAGAVAAGIDSLFIAGGIHARELLRQPQPQPQQPQQPVAAGESGLTPAVSPAQQPQQPQQQSEPRAAGGPVIAPGVGVGVGVVDMEALTQLVGQHHLGGASREGGRGGRPPSWPRGSCGRAGCG